MNRTSVLIIGDPRGQSIFLIDAKSLTDGINTGDWIDMFAPVDKNATENPLLYIIRQQLIEAIHSSLIFL
ncbi:hypothetical protein [Candidatus Albibeggiatoa sp. nov. NOAA]|uniref:hypothetical protein n=1 Tax=Candidatus Albibeggiatoa sp. nov. NOAA TaxID=3162724 RepID=UPI0033007E70|nr:hypothetical protein [Thiotrichaceae bacterium]